MPSSRARRSFCRAAIPLQWSTRIGGTPLATAIRRANACGKAVGAVGGSAAFLGNHMLVYREDTAFPCMAAGLGLSNRMLVAGHFDPDLRGPLLRMAIAANPYMLGIGLPDQAAFIRRSDNLLEVVGLASVQIVDGSQMTRTNLVAWQPGLAFEAEGLRWSTCRPTIATTRTATAYCRRSWLCRCRCAARCSRRKQPWFS